jgi:AcrR family transcriptional regulator
VAEPVSAQRAAGDGEGGRRVRKSSAARRAELLAAALAVFSAGDTAERGMADVAEAAGVSNGLLYHYFPGGRAELVDAVGRSLLDDLCARMAVAGNLPFSPLGRLEHVLAIVFGFFAERPVAYPLLFGAPGGAQPTEDGVGALASVRLVAMLASLMAGSGLAADELHATGERLLDLVVTQIGTCRDGRLDPEAAWRASCRRARSLLRADP